MKKLKKEILGKDNYLLGVNHEGEKVWLEEATWDCEWYWGIGYVEIYNKRYTDINSHQHFEGMFLNRNIYDGFKAYFKETTLNDNEIWQLLEMMKQLYILRTYSDMLHLQGGHITEIKESILKTKENLEANTKEYKRINKILIPEILKEIYKLLTINELPTERIG